MHEEEKEAEEEEESKGKKKKNIFFRGWFTSFFLSSGMPVLNVFSLGS